MSTIKTFEQGTKAIVDTLKYYERFIEQIKNVLDTEENGEALVEVIRNAHKAEQELASLKRKLIEEFEDEVDINNNGGPNTAMRVMNIVKGI